MSNGEGVGHDGGVWPERIGFQVDVGAGNVFAHRGPNRHDHALAGIDRHIADRRLRFLQVVGGLISSSRHDSTDHCGLTAHHAPPSAWKSNPSKHSTGRCTTIDGRGNSTNGPLDLLAERVGQRNGDAVKRFLEHPASHRQRKLTAAVDHAAARQCREPIRSSSGTFESPSNPVMRSLSCTPTLFDRSAASIVIRSANPRDPAPEIIVRFFCRKFIFTGRRANTRYIHHCSEQPFVIPARRLIHFVRRDSESSSTDHLDHDILLQTQASIDACVLSFLGLNR